MSQPGLSTQVAKKFGPSQRRKSQHAPIHAGQDIARFSPARPLEMAHELRVREAACPSKLPSESRKEL
jgi:hypothetical protein